MADIKITQLTTGSVKTTDLYPAVDTTDVTQAPSGTTKKYTVLNLIQASRYVATVVTVTNLNATYANGTLGVGATLTNAGAQVAFSTDGVTPAINSVILVSGQISTFQNGLYNLTTVGSGAANWVLTRAQNYNQVAEISAGDLIAVISGTTYGFTQWMQTSTIVTMGTTAILFSQLNSAGTGLIKTDNSIALTIPVTVTSGGTGLTSTTANQLLYSSATSVISGLASANNGVLITSGAGVPSISSTIPSATQDNITRLGTIASIGTSLGVSFGGTGASSSTAYAVICGGTTSTGAHQSIASVGTSGQVLTSNGAGALPTFQTSTSAAVQQVRTFTASTLTGTTILPSDNTIPQNTEGDQYLSLAITPTNSAHILVVSGQLLVRNSATNQGLSVAAFQDSNVNAFGVITEYMNEPNGAIAMAFTFYVTAGTTSATTISIRAGSNTAGTTTINGSTFGGVAFSGITITEYIA